MRQIKYILIDDSGLKNREGWVQRELRCRSPWFQD